MQDLLSGPQLLAEIKDFVEALMKQLDPVQHRVISLKQCGWANRDIAIHLNKSLRTIERILASVEPIYIRLISTKESPKLV